MFIKRETRAAKAYAYRMLLGFKTSVTYKLLPDMHPFLLNIVRYSVVIFRSETCTQDDKYGSGCSKMSYQAVTLKNLKNSRAKHLRGSPLFLSYREQAFNFNVKEVRNRCFSMTFSRKVIFNSYGCLLLQIFQNCSKSTKAGQLLMTVK